KQDILEARNIGVTGVPFFLLNNKYTLSGAQPVDLFVEALTQTYNETNASNSAEGESCTIDGCE
ncbi:MAG: DsbA family protein, partial [Myroides sp.]